jgi:hypothetical protein
VLMFRHWLMKPEIKVDWNLDVCGGVNVVFVAYRNTVVSGF